MKPALAQDVDFNTLKYPTWGQPKIDGVRAMHITGQLTGRSLDPHKGFGITEYFSHSAYRGLDGEMTLGHDPASSDRLCSLTTGAMSRFKGVGVMPEVYWWVFDYLTPDTLHLPYKERYRLLCEYVLEADPPRVAVVPYVVINNRAEAEALVAKHLDEGYEGTIFRNPEALHKDGRPTKTGQQLMRVKPWSDAEALVTGITEGQTNNNEAKVNSLGRTERSSAKEGMVPNGMVGSIQATMLVDFYNPNGGELLFAKGLPITISPGEMTDKEAEHYFQHPEEIVGHIAKFKTLTHGVKDLPRFPGYISHRAKEDMS